MENQRFLHESQSEEVIGGSTMNSTRQEPGLSRPELCEVSMVPWDTQRELFSCSIGQQAILINYNSDPFRAARTGRINSLPKSTRQCKNE